MFWLFNLSLYIPVFLDRFFIFTNKKSDAIPMVHFIMLLKIYYLFNSFDNILMWWCSFERNKYFSVSVESEIFSILLYQVFQYNYGKQYSFIFRDRVLKIPYIKCKVWYIRLFFFILEVFRHLSRLWFKWSLYNFSIMCILWFFLLVIYLFYHVCKIF